MPPRHDQTPWTAREERALATACQRGMTSADTADWINRTLHNGRPVRTPASVSIRRGKLRLKVAKRPKDAPKVPAPDEETRQTLDVVDGGDEVVVRTYGSEITTIDELIARAKIDLTKYEVDRPETSMHETTVRDATGKIRVVQNFRIVARFRLKAGPGIIEQVEAVIAGAFQKRRPVQKILKSSRKTNGNPYILQAVVIADPHIGKYAWRHETGDEDYDVDIATRLLRQASAELLADGESRKVGRRVLLMLGDILHYDTPHGQTTKGTPLDRDGRVEKMVREASQALFDIIEESAAQLPTDIVMVPGNHDALMTVALRQILASYFRNDRRVRIDSGGTTRKYLTHGKCLLGVTHGDKAKKRLGELMAAEAPEAWGKSTLREIHTGHLHSVGAVESIAGVVIRTAPALCPPDGWHSAEGFVKSTRGMEAYYYAADGYLAGMTRASVR